MISKSSGEYRMGMIVVLAVTIIPFTLGFAGNGSARSFSVEADDIDAPSGVRLCIPVPESNDFDITFTSDGRLLKGRIVETAYIRDQKVAIFEIGEIVEGDLSIEVEIEMPDDATPHCVDTGPLGRMCSDMLVGYSLSQNPPPPTGPGTVDRCQNLTECRNARADILLISGSAIYQSTYVDSLALLWAQRMRLNVATINVANISPYSPIAIRDFIQDLYNSATAEHFGDGHLGFLVLLGDAYEDDNATSMMPEYDGYGWRSEASDHFYACVSGEDDFEDLMIGRIPAGNEQELINYYRKLDGYSPLPAEDWVKSILLAGGCYFAQRDDYVAYFDSLECYVPDDYTVSRLYRYDYPHTDQGDGEAIQAFIDEVDTGRLFVLYSGDGDEWDWGGRFERLFRSTYIDDLNNAQNLPIVLSISCSNGWFDNTSDVYSDGGVDCLAERLVLEPDVGAIACVASPRETPGGASTEFAPEIIKSLFVNGSTFLGELMLEAKTRHLIHLGNVLYARQFNLFGDPCLNFVLEDFPVAAPDLIIRPYSVEITPEFPMAGQALRIDAEVWNASGLSVAEFDVTVFSGHPDSGGVALDTRMLTDFWGWEKRAVSFTITQVGTGDLDIHVVADASAAIGEMDEANNSVQLTSYVYPVEMGYPVKTSDDVEGQVITDLDGNGKPDILITSGGTQAQAISFDGSLLWLLDDLGLPQWFDGILPTAFDLNGDGTVEAILTTRSSLLVTEGATGNKIWQKYTDYPVVSPLVTDLDADGSFEVLHGTYSFNYSMIYAYTASGSYHWVYTIPTLDAELTGMVVCDIDLDGFKEVVFGTNDGVVTCLTCSENPPGIVWQTPVSGQELSCIVGGDLERDGTIEIIAGCGDSVYVIDSSDGGVAMAIACPASILQMSLGDLDGDSDLEIVCTAASGLVLEIDNGTLGFQADIGDAAAGAPALADVDGDGTVEIILASEGGWLRILNPDLGDHIPPVPMRGMCMSGPSVCDMDDDGNIEIVAGSTDSLLFMLDLGSAGGSIEWSCEGGTITRPGLYAQPLYGAISDELILSGRIDAVGDIVVESTGSLVLDRSTEIRFIHDGVYPAGPSVGKCEIIVNGDFYAIGSLLAGVSLRPISVPHGDDEWAGLVVEDGGYASLSKTSISGALTGIECRTSNVTISECVVSDCVLGIKLDDASPLIDHNTITRNDHGISASNSSPIIVGNVIVSNVSSGIILSSSSDATLDDNVLRGTTQGHGLACYSSCPLILPRNKFDMNSSCGIYLSNSSPSIDSCWIGYNGDCGLKVTYYSDPVISKTSIVGNSIGVGVYTYSSPVLGDTSSGLGRLNDIRQNTEYALYNMTLNQIEAQGNWWGDSNPDPAIFYGPVDYSDWLDLSPAGIDGVPGQLESLLTTNPNPFRHLLRIRLSAAQGQTPLSVSVFDIRGRLIRELISVRSPGETYVEWDATDNYGNAVASGTYLLCISSPAGTHTRKVILLR